MNSNDFRECMLDILDEIMTEEEIDKAIPLFEKFVKCHVKEDGFDETTANVMIENSEMSSRCKIAEVQRIKTFFEKMLKLKKEEFTEEKLELYYRKIDFYNCYNGENESIRAGKRLELLRFLWGTYLRTCLENENIIDKAYHENSNFINIDIMEYAKNCKERIENEKDITSRYVQLTEENPICAGKRVTKFLGGAGAGKTTAMRRCYYLELDNVLKNKAHVLPIWIDLKEIAHKELLEIIGQCLEMDRVAVQEFLKLNDKEKAVKIILYLDGYNEILVTSESGKHEKVRISDEIEKFYQEHQDIIFMMTDRKGSIQIPVFKRTLYDVYIVECKEMDSTHIENYLNKKAEPSKDGEKSVWETFKDTEWTIKASWTPAKLEKLMDYLKIQSSTLPKNEEEFNFEYITSILTRERDQKKDASLDLICRLLNRMAKEFTDAEDSVEKEELINRWNTIPEKVDSLLERILQIPLLRQHREGNEKYISFIDLSYYLYFKDKHYNRINEED